MKRIFLTLAVLAHISMLTAMILGLQVGDPMTMGGRDPVVNDRINGHILFGLGAFTGVTHGACTGVHMVYGYRAVGGRIVAGLRDVE
ncbi:MAG UNVERIFIED_CONTAM: hypothetical protein LVR18_38365 [Planctomycetaceae bacterium]|jgi:hypothetical protein